LIPGYLGVKERYVYAALAIAILTYLVRYRRLILSTAYSILIIAIALLGTSVAIDHVFEPWMRGLGQGRIFIEDGTKWLGIAAWCSYYVRTSYGLTMGALRLADRPIVRVTEP
jgi:disulfide bond formation protein DsbB